MEVINLERKLNTREQVEAFNANVFGDLKMHEDYKYPFAISQNMLNQIELEKGEWWGTMEQVSRYAMGQCIDMGYIPWKLNYFEFDRKGEDGGYHKFYFSCEDRRITNRPDKGLGQP